jgi:hypothetical protein
MRGKKDLIGQHSCRHRVIGKNDDSLATREVELSHNVDKLVQLLDCVACWLPVGGTTQIFSPPSFLANK